MDYPYPEESIREAIVNAVAHRDYTVSGIDIRVDIYPDRLEIESPGKLPNTISLESIRLGSKYYRNQILVQYLKEAGFMDLHSLGIPVKILKLCTEYTGREPDLIESGNSFKITFYPKRKTVVSKVEEKILKLLRTSAEPMKTREISIALGVSKRTTINWINHLIDKNIVEPTSENRNDPNCKYRLRY
ncbi:MAG: ATP-binding protein [Thermodesulfobacteriota bacterium]|nr:ATP-binding protein [Thermodesulfobacteriota bacterium]